MAAYARAHGAAFGRILAMPNTVPPLTEASDILEYSRAAESACSGLRVWTAFQLMEGMSGAHIAALAAAGVRVGKYYPNGATTNSQSGVSDWHDVSSAIEAMEKHGLVLCVHGEDPSAPVLDREEAFLPTFQEIRRTFPGLKMVLEHVSTANGVRMILEDRGPSAATVTVQHLLFTLDDLLGGLLNPHLFCKPVLKTQAHRQAIERVVFEGHPKFFFGSDSAPHEPARKHSDSCPAGVYTAPMILPALAAFFEKAGKLEQLKPFLCDFGRDFYGVPANHGTVTLEREPWSVPLESEGCIPLMAGKVLDWRVASVFENLSASGVSR